MRCGTGVKAVDSEGNEIIIKAKATLLATGGFGASEELRPEGLEDVVFYGASSSTGDGIVMAEAIGAQTHYMDYIKIYPQGIFNPPENKYNEDGALNRNGIIVPLGCKQATDNTGAIYVNLDGKRFVDETKDFVAIKEAQLEQKDKKMFIVMDQAGYENFLEMTKGQLSEEKAEEFIQNEGKEEPIFVRDNSLAEAAKKAGLDSEQLVKTVENFNKMVEEGVDKEFNRQPL